MTQMPQINADQKKILYLSAQICVICAICVQLFVPVPWKTFTPQPSAISAPADSPAPPPQTDIPASHCTRYSKETAAADPSPRPRPPPSSSGHGPAT